MGVLKIIRFILKNTASFVIGAIFGLIITWTFLMKYLLKATILTDNALGAIISIILFSMLYSILAIVIGGVLGIVVYNVCRKKRLS